MEIQRAASAMESDASDEIFGDADFCFHLAFAKAGKNAIFESTLSMLRRQVVFGMRLVGEFQTSMTTRSEIVHVEHHAIIDAVRRRNPEDAQMAMGQHIA